MFFFQTNVELMQVLLNFPIGIFLFCVIFSLKYLKFGFMSLLKQHLSIHLLIKNAHWRTILVAVIILPFTPSAKSFLSKIITIFKFGTKFIVFDLYKNALLAKAYMRLWVSQIKWVSSSPIGKSFLLVLLFFLFFSSARLALHNRNRNVALKTPTCFV